MIDFSQTAFSYSQSIPLEVPGPVPEWVSRVDAPAAAIVVRFSSLGAGVQPAGRIGFLMFGYRSAGTLQDVAWLAESGQPVILDTPYLFSGLPDLPGANGRNNARPGTARLCAALWRSRYKGPLFAAVRGYW